MRLIEFSGGRTGPIVAATLALGALTACGQAPSSAKPAPPDPIPGEIKIVKQILERDLMDPSTVQYRNVQRVAVNPTYPGAVVYCGEINAKNSFGGYVGFRHFEEAPVVLKKRYPADIDDPTYSYRSIGWEVFCKGKTGTPVQF